MSDSTLQATPTAPTLSLSESNPLPTIVDSRLPAPLVFNDVAAAIYLGLQPTTLRKWRSLGTGPVYIKVGRTVKYTLADLKNYLQQQAVPR